MFKGRDGKDIPAGAPGQANGAREGFVVGYDGRSYITGLQASNTATIEVNGVPCRAQFAYTPQRGVQQVIGPVVCQ